MFLIFCSSFVIGLFLTLFFCYSFLKKMKYIGAIKVENILLNWVYFKFHTEHTNWSLFFVLWLYNCWERKKDPFFWREREREDHKQLGRKSSSCRRSTRTAATTAARNFFLAQLPNYASKLKLVGAWLTSFYLCRYDETSKSYYSCCCYWYCCCCCGFTSVGLM